MAKSGKLIYERQFVTIPSSQRGRRVNFQSWSTVRWINNRYNMKFVNDLAHQIYQRHCILIATSFVIWISTFLAQRVEIYYLLDTFWCWFYIKTMNTKSFFQYIPRHTIIEYFREDIFRLFVSIWIWYLIIFFILFLPVHHQALQYTLVLLLLQGKFKHPWSNQCQGTIYMFPYSTNVILLKTYLHGWISH